MIQAGTWLVTLTLYACPTLSGPFGIGKTELPVPLSLRPFVCDAVDKASLFAPSDKIGAERAVLAAPYENRVAAFRWDGKEWKQRRVHWRVVLEP